MTWLIHNHLICCCYPHHAFWNSEIAILVQSFCRYPLEYLDVQLCVCNKILGLFQFLSESLLTLFHGQYLQHLKFDLTVVAHVHEHDLAEQEYVVAVELAHVAISTLIRMIIFSKPKQIYESYLMLNWNLLILLLLNLYRLLKLLLLILWMRYLLLNLEIIAKLVTSITNIPGSVEGVLPEVIFENWRLLMKDRWPEKTLK